MKRDIRRPVCAAIALVALMPVLSGCWPKQLSVEIPDFEVNLIQGLQLWRGEGPESEALGEAGRIVFGDCYFHDQYELLSYTMSDSRGQPLEAAVSAWVVRSEDDGSVTLHFFFPDWTEPPGWIRVSTYNAVGESDLSDEATYF